MGGLYIVLFTLMVKIKWKDNDLLTLGWIVVDRLLLVAYL